jgi:hypothetical protein
VLALALCAFAYALCVNLYVITLPGPQEYRESAMIVATDALARGENLYSIPNQPQLTNMYGIGYHALMAPIARLAGGSTFSAHRIVSTLLTLASCALIVAELRRQKLQWSLAIVAGVLLYLDLAVRGADLRQRALPETILARPDALGLLLFLLSVLIPLRFDFSSKSLGVSVALAVLALLTKPYFSFGYGVVAAHLLLIGRWRRRGVIYLLAGGASLALTVVVATSLMPTYAANVITGSAAASAAHSSWRHLFAQLGTYLIELPGTIVIVVISVRVMRQRPLPFATFAAVCAAVILLLKLGRYEGNSMIYFAHLLTPFLLLAAFGAIAMTPPTRRWGWLLLILLDLLLLPLTAVSPPRAHAEVWDRWERLLETKKNVYAPPPLDWILIRQHKPVYDGGLSDSFLQSMKRPIYPPAQVLQDRYAAFLDDLRAHVVQQRFDLIVLPYFDGDASPSFLPAGAVQEFYRPIGTLDLPMDWQPGWSAVVYEPARR